MLDLDNTLWGGVIGDDGLEVSCSAKATPPGEAFLAFQRYAAGACASAASSSRCARKNDERSPSRPFDRASRDGAAARGHRGASWRTGTTRPRTCGASPRRSTSASIALVFVDDNPAEREHVRQELPEVAVPELPDDPAHYRGALADAGYFEAFAFTDEDAQRTDYYQANAAARALLEADATDMDGFLAPWP